MTQKKPTIRSNNQADAILIAASQVIAQDGAGKLTIDAVAKKAGMSKGGVLYHFPSKDALLEGMLNALLARIEKRRATEKKSKLSGMLNSIDLQDEAERAISLAILATAAQKPELLAPARAYFSQVNEEVSAETKDPDVSSILLLALEGMRFLNMLELSPWSNAESERILKRMHQMADEVSS
ncbi:MAG: AcrR family transcriptional regulator [Candidatus Azotimanducaceae bacterium]|jgi:AcrR family transcriptional regulator